MSAPRATDQQPCGPARKGSVSLTQPGMASGTPQGCSGPHPQCCLLSPPVAPSPKGYLWSGPP